MTKAHTSGYSLSPNDAKIVLGMIERGDRKHDIAAWFGVNQGRIKDVEDGKYGTLEVAPQEDLPPSGPPGIKGRRLRIAVKKALQALQASHPEHEACKLLSEAAVKFDKNEL